MMAEVRSLQYSRCCEQGKREAFIKEAKREEDAGRLEEGKKEESGNDSKRKEQFKMILIMFFVCCNLQP